MQIKEIYVFGMPGTVCGQGWMGCPSQPAGGWGGGLPASPWLPGQAPRILTICARLPWQANLLHTIWTRLHVTCKRVQILGWTPKDFSRITGFFYRIIGFFYILLFGDEIMCKSIWTCLHVRANWIRSCAPGVPAQAAWVRPGRPLPPIPGRLAGAAHPPVAKRCQAYQIHGVIQFVLVSMWFLLFFWYIC